MRHRTLLTLRTLRTPSLSTTVSCPALSPPQQPQQQQRHFDANARSPFALDKFDLALAQNRIWAHRAAQSDPHLLPTLAKGQSPEILWIGCSDSRIPETTVCGLKPGDIFVHRNIANIVPPGDLNSGSVIEYAVAHLKVKHIILCGHTSCGGVNAALGNKKIGGIDAWLMPLRSLRAKLSKELEGLGQDQKVLRLVEENVRSGVRTLRENPYVLAAGKERGVVVHGLVYDVGSGELRELEVGDEEDVVEARLQAFETV